MKNILFLASLAVLFLGCATAPGEKVYKPEMVQHIKGSIFEATDRGYYTTELVMKPSPPVIGDNKAQLIIHDYTAKDIPGLDIEVVPLLTSKGLKSEEQVTVLDAGRGLYLLENIVFTEPGMWQLKLTISGPETDAVVLDLPEVK